MLAMDVGLTRVQNGVGNPEMRGGGDSETNEGEVSNGESMTLHHDRDGMSEPYLGMEFDSEEAAQIFYEDYARGNGFSSKSGPFRSNADGIIVARDFICGKEGPKRRITRNCDAMMKIELKDQRKWVVTKFTKEHSHSMVSPNKVHYLRPRRHFAGAVKNTTDSSRDVGVVPSGVLYVSMEGNHANVEASRGTKIATVESNRLLNNVGFVNYSIRSMGRKRTLGRDGQNLLEYFKKMQAENPGFFYAIQLDEENHMVNVFWADGRSRAAYNHYGDVVTVDTMYRVYQYGVPCVPFTGVNHHGQKMLFGCALLLDDSEASFIWLFRTFLTAMNDQCPISIVTDQDKAIQIAASQVFPEARHCISKWHVLREGQEKLAPVCREHPNFQLELYTCINLTETIEEFELSWNAVIHKYDLRRNEWLHSLYNARAQWAPVYFRNSFFAALSPNQGFDGSFFDGYVNHQTTLPIFFRQYEMALDNCFEKEIEADLDTLCTMPVLKTPSPMEKQAANLYTKKIFARFQEELVETFVYTANRIEGDDAISTFRVAKFEDDQKAYFVRLNYSELTANCSCQMFEHSGILCRHVLTVFTVTNVLTLPSCYILKRWTRNAKSGPCLDDQVGELQGQISPTTRYKSLCREAMKFADEGAASLESFNAAFSVLREGRKKISMVKKNVKVSPPTSHAGGISYNGRTSSGAPSDMTPLLWPRQDEMARQLKFNNMNIPTQSSDDLHYPCISPVSLHQDEISHDSMVVLPCLKSMTWLMEKKETSEGNKVAVINLKLQDYSKNSSAEMEVKFHLSNITMEPMLRSMASISDQLSASANRVAVINLKLQDAETSSGESEVKFQVSKDTLGAMLRSMAYIHQQLSNASEPQTESAKKKRK
ncbi:hypothetical protein SAY86_031771 [Trapa natans]|uniref:Protein FAR1-RELATED SEQUENCE n=1 Tax=Trapa natans TaxID=22666 RepID=A0AAN7RA08_TRANT|nr:hypothetical protein SAY86_031771 [Trapa natans]